MNVDGDDPYMAFTDSTELNYVTAQRRVAYSLVNGGRKPSSHVRSVSHPNMTVLPNHSPASPSVESFKMSALDGGGYGFSFKFPVNQRKIQEFQDSVQTYATPTSLQSFEEARSTNGSPAFVEVDPYDIAHKPSSPVERSRRRHVKRTTERNRSVIPHNGYASTAREFETMMRLVSSNTPNFEDDLLAEFGRLNLPRERHRQKRIVRTKSEEPSVNNRSTINLRTPLFPSYSADCILEENWLIQHENDGPRFEPSDSISSYSAVGYSTPKVSKKHFHRN